MVTAAAASGGDDPPEHPRKVAESVPDPELPMVTVADLGILRDVRADGDTVTVTVTPTYSGCPAMHEIAADLRRRLEQAGYRHVDIRMSLSPPWTTDWITPEGRRKLAAAGISPPAPTAETTSATSPTAETTSVTSPTAKTTSVTSPTAETTSVSSPTAETTSVTSPVTFVPLTLVRTPVTCPRCGSRDTRETARFSATACKALYKCRACLEPFEHVKEF